MAKGILGQDIVELVREKIHHKQEGPTWDFKKQWHSDNNELLFDIICMSNTIEHEDGLIIIGVDESRDYFICGVEQDSFRKKTQDVVCLLRDKPFAFGVRPVVYVETIKIKGHEVDIVVVKDSNDTPFYVTKRINQIQPYHIYTRVMDTNTARDKSADPNVVESLWKKRFGIDQPTLQRAMIYLKDIESWSSIDGGMSYFYRYAPEFTLRYEKNPEKRGYEYYVFGQVDTIPGWYDIYLYYHQTMIYHSIGVSLDGGKFFTAAPEYNYFHSITAKEDIWFYCYVEGTIQHLLYSFFSHEFENSDSRMAKSRFLSCIPIFTSESEQRSFFGYATMEFKRDRRFVTNEHMMPRFPDNLPCVDIAVYKDAYRDALLIKDLYQEFSVGKDKLPKYIG